MLNLPILSDILNATSSPESEDGVMLSDSQDGPIALQFGRALAHANLSARQAKAADLLTSGIYGPPSSISLRSANLQQSLGNKLQAKMGSNGSPLFKMTWKLRDIPQRQPIYALRASGLRTSGKDSSGWPTPDTNKRGGPQHPEKRKSGGHSVTLQDAATLTSWNTPRATDGSNGGPNQAGGALSAQASWATPTAPTAHDSDASAFRWNPNKKQTDAVSQILGRTQALSDVPTEKRGQLNPLFSLWLMGYPIEWGYCGVLVTLSSRKSRRKS